MALQGVYGQNMTNYSTPLLGFEVADQAWGLGFVVREFGVRSSGWVGGWVGANGITGFHELGLTIGFRSLGFRASSETSGDFQANPVDAHVAFSSYSLSLMLASAVGGAFLVQDLRGGM